MNLSRSTCCLSDTACSPQVSCRTHIQTGRGCNPSRNGLRLNSSTSVTPLWEPQKEIRRCWKASAGPSTVSQTGGLYEELGVESTASKADIKKAYRQKALQVGSPQTHRFSLGYHYLLTSHWRRQLELLCRLLQQLQISTELHHCHRPLSLNSTPRQWQLPACFLWRAPRRPCCKKCSMSYPHSATRRSRPVSRCFTASSGHWKDERLVRSSAPAAH